MPKQWLLVQQRPSHRIFRGRGLICIIKHRVFHANGPTEGPCHIPPLPGVSGRFWPNSSHQHHMNHFSTMVLYHCPLPRLLWHELGTFKYRYIQAGGLRGLGNTIYPMSISPKEVFILTIPGLNAKAVTTGQTVTQPHNPILAKFIRSKMRTWKSFMV